MWTRTLSRKRLMSTPNLTFKGGKSRLMVGPPRKPWEITTTIFLRSQLAPLPHKSHPVQLKERTILACQRSSHLSKQHPRLATSRASGTFQIHSDLSALSILTVTHKRKFSQLLSSPTSLSSYVQRARTPYTTITKSRVRSTMRIRSSRNQRLRDAFMISWRGSRRRKSN